MTFAQTLIDDLVATTLAAGRIVMEVYACDFAVGTKGDASPVTLADERAEAAILADLERILPGVPVVAEEAVAAGRVPVLGRRFVLVDPLDGTREFVGRNGEFTVNIALVEDGRPVVGVVGAPALGEIFVGVVGKGARAGRVGDGGTVVWCDVATRQAPEGGLAVLASRSHCDAVTEALIARLPVATRVGAGSSLKFCRLAAGEADLYPRFGRTMEWDTAAGEAVLVAAGGDVAGIDGRPLAYGRDRVEGDAPFANPWFVAAGRREVLDRALAVAGSLVAPERGSHEK